MTVSNSVLFAVNNQIRIYDEVVCVIDDLISKQRRIDSNEMKWCTSSYTIRRTKAILSTTRR